MFVMSRRLLREYMREILTEQDVKFSGILKIMPSPSMVAQAEEIVKTLPLETTVPWMAQLEVPDPNMQCRMDDMGIMSCRTIPLSPYKFHVTLAHQSVLKPFRKLLSDERADLRPLLAKSVTKGKIARLRLIVEVLGTHPGMFVTQ